MSLEEPAAPAPDAPAHSVFRHEVVAAPGDIDELEHVSNVVYVRWVQDVAVAHSEAVGLDHAAYRRIGGIFVVRRHEVEYVLPVYRGERLAVTTFITGWKGASSERHTSLVRLADGREVARARTLWVFVSLDGGRPRRIPPEVRTAFGFG